jgi:hypothetical protein
MPKATADAKQKEMKGAAKKIAANGITRPRHEPLTSKTPPFKASFPDNPYLKGTGDASGTATGRHLMEQADAQGVDTDPEGVVHSEHAATSGALNQMKESIMTTETKPTPGTDGVAKAAALKAEKEALKAKKAQERAEAQAKAKAEKEAKAAAAKAEREAKAAAKAAEKEAAMANKAPRVRTYLGSMLSLSNRAASGVYVKGANGQLRSTDDLAVALESIPAKRMVAFLLHVLGLTANPYEHLNYGQQSMNLRNRLRGVLKAGGIVVEPAVKAVKEVKAADGTVTTPGVEAKPAVLRTVTIETVKAARDEGNWTHDPEAEAKAAKAAKAEPATA